MCYLTFDEDKLEREIEEMISPSNVVRILEAHNTILDCTDNPPTRYLLPDVAVLLGREWGCPTSSW